MCGELHTEPFSQGNRFWRMDDAVAPDGKCDRSLSRPAVDPGGRLVRVLDVPPWVATDQATIRDLLDGASKDVPETPTNEAPAGPAIRGIEFGLDVFQGGDCTVHWRTGGSRLYGQVLLARSAPELVPEFAQYLLRISWQLRFVGVGSCSEGIAVRAVVPTDDERWRELSGRALAAAVRHLQSQTVWWTAPAELLAGLFSQYGTTVVT